MKYLLSFVFLLAIAACGSADTVPVNDPTVIEIGNWGVFAARDASSWKLATDEHGRLLTFASEQGAREALIEMRAIDGDERTLTVGKVGGLRAEDGTHGCDTCLPPPHFP